MGIILKKVGPGGSDFIVIKCDIGMVPLILS